jgi:hypothetical protein
MNFRSHWPILCPAANRCGGWGPCSPVPSSAHWGWSPLGRARSIRARRSANVAMPGSRASVSRPARHAMEIPAASAGPVALTPAVRSRRARGCAVTSSPTRTAEPAGTIARPMGRRAAATIAPISRTMSSTAGVAGRCVTRLVRTNPSPVCPEPAFTTVPRVLPTAATGHVPTCVSTPRTAVPAGTPAADQPRSVRMGPARPCTANTATWIGTAKTAAFAVTYVLRTARVPLVSAEAFASIADRGPVQPENAARITIRLPLSMQGIDHGSSFR